MMTKWVDFGVPTFSANLTDLLRKEKKAKLHQSNTSFLIVLHEQSEM